MRPVCSLIILLLALLAGFTLIANSTSPSARNRDERTTAEAAAQGTTVAEGNEADVVAWRQVSELPVPVAQFATVFWEADDTVSLRQRIATTALVREKQVLEIGTGTGLLALCCLQAGARRVVATDVNPAALANARYNARRLGLSERLDTRLVSPMAPQAFVVIERERFDVILSNPPWEDARPLRVEDAAFYDPGFTLLDSLVAGLEEHLAPGGKALLAYGHTPAIRRVLRRAEEQGLQARILDERSLDDLPTSFLPGMLIELTRRDAAR